MAAKDPRKIAAATAAVRLFLEDEKRQAEAQILPAPAAAPPPGQPSVWAVSGSLLDMQLQNLMRYRMFRMV